MAAPIIPEQQNEPKESAGLREDVLLDDIDTRLKEQEAAQKKDAEEAEAKRKAELEAKARQDLLASQGEDPRVKALQEALRISEEARKRQESLAAPAAPAPEPVKKMTRDELNDLYQKDPLAAIELMQAEATRMATENLERRLGPLMSGSASMGEESARRKYAEEFELFGPAIKDYIERLPDKSVMSRPEAWDDLVSWFRGRPGNFEKIIEHRQMKAENAKAEEARKMQAEGAGAHARSEIRAPSSAGSKMTLDDTQREIARALSPGLSPDKAYEEYIKWMRVTNG